MKRRVYFSRAILIILVISFVFLSAINRQLKLIKENVELVEDSFVSNTRFIEDNANIKKAPVDIKEFYFNLYPEKNTRPSDEGPAISDNKDISIKYPVLKPGLLSSEMTLKINEDIASSAKSTFDDTVKYLKDTKIEDQGSGTMEGNYLYYQEKIDQDSFYFNPTTRIFSYPTLIYSYVGGAHGGFSYQSHNIDTLTGKEIVITDILKNNYEKTITDYIKSQITKAIKKGSEIKGCGNCENLDMDNSDFAYGWQSKISLRNFVLKGDGIYFLFNNYDLASYAETAGGQMIIVPKSFLKDSIKRDW